MKLRKRIAICFAIVIIVPVTLAAATLAGTLYFQADAIRQHYGIDVAHLEAFDKSMVFSLIFSILVILIITGVVMTLWLTRGVSAPIQSMMKATQQIRDGNLDFELKPEGNVEEINLLFESFEEMRRKLKETNEANLEFDRQSRELISNISHDLRTPITAVKGYCEGIMDGVADTPEKQERYVRTIYNKANEMDHLINELSFYSRISTNRIPYVFDRLDVNAFFDDAAEGIAEDLQTRGIRFGYTNSVREGTYMIADAEQIARVLNNLVGNAIKYNDKEEKIIKLNVSTMGDEIRVSVEDNGRGIPADDLANVFERFYRTDASRNSSRGGSGIGLSIVKKIIEDHGGRIWATSTEGVGTGMHFELRKYQEAEKDEQNIDH